MNENLEEIKSERQFEASEWSGTEGEPGNWRSLRHHARLADRANRKLKR